MIIILSSENYNNFQADLPFFFLFFAFELFLRKKDKMGNAIFR